MNTSAKERQESLAAFGLVLVVLLVYVLWTAVQALPGLGAGARQRPFVLSSEGLIFSTSAWLLANSRLLAAVVFLLGVTAFLARFMVAGCGLAYIYADSPAAGMRSGTAFLANALAIVGQCGLALAVVRAFAAECAHTALVMVIGLLALNTIWLTALAFAAGMGKDFEYGWLRRSAGFSLLMTIALVVLVWHEEGTSAAWTRTASGTSLAGSTLVLLCGLDAALQWRQKSGIGPRGAVAILAVAATVAVIGLLIYYVD